jgi:hypothetical protein
MKTEKKKESKSIMFKKGDFLSLKGKNSGEVNGTDTSSSCHDREAQPTHGCGPRSITPYKRVWSAAF